MFMMLFGIGMASSRMSGLIETTVQRHHCGNAKHVSCRAISIERYDGREDRRAHTMTLADRRGRSSPPTERSVEQACINRKTEIHDGEEQRYRRRRDGLYAINHHIAGSSCPNPPRRPKRNGTRISAISAVRVVCGHEDRNHCVGEAW